MCFRGRLVSVQAVTKVVMILFVCLFVCLRGQVFGDCWESVLYGAGGVEEELWAGG